MNKYIQLHELDNVLIVIRPIDKGECLPIDGTDTNISAPLQVGHKIAACFISSGETIIKYGVPIGLATRNIAKGEHVHLHNVKSAYIPTYTLETQFKEANK